MRFYDNEEITNFVNLFVSVIICFPEVTTIKYDRDSDEIYFNFILKDVKSIKNIKKSLNAIDEALKGYHRLESTKHYEYGVKVKNTGEYAVLEVHRDMKSINRPEISFLIELFRTQFLDNLLMELVDQEQDSDYHWFFQDSHEAEFQQETNEVAPEKKRIKYDEKSIGNNILVCREEGKVLVFSNS
ncbi:MAG: hypothetical protein RSC20_00365 [Clostridiales bacterium]